MPLPSWIFYPTAAIAGIMLLFIILYFTGQRTIRLKMQALEAKRPDISLPEFIDAVPVDIRQDKTVIDIYHYFNKRFYSNRRAPHNEDILLDDLGVEPEEIEEITEDFYIMYGMEMPSCSQPEEIPQLRTINDFIIYFASCKNEARKSGLHST